MYYEDVDVTINIPHFELLKGDTVSIMGKGGEGKTTVLNILSGMTKLTEGYMTFDGNSLKHTLMSGQTVTYTKQ